MTPAEVLAAAADKLDALASSATRELRLDDIESGLFPEDIAYIEAMGPDRGKALAAWLRAEAKALDPKSVMVQRILTGDVLGVPVEHPLALARLILGDES